MRLTPNLNGTSREELVRQRVEICHALDAAIGKMRDAFPHGRDYQLSPDPEAARKADADEWLKLTGAMYSFTLRLGKEIEEIQDAGSQV